MAKCTSSQRERLKIVWAGTKYVLACRLLSWSLKLLRPLLSNRSATIFHAFTKSLDLDADMWIEASDARLAEYEKTDA